MRLITLWLTTLLGIALSACHPTETSKVSSDMVSVMTDSVNYSHERAMAYTLYDLSRTPPVAVGGASTFMLASGGEKGCCLNLPSIWHPGIKVRVTWDESDRERSYPEKYSRDMEIPRYDRPADLFVVFYPGPQHDVELVVSAAEPGHPDWRGRVKESTWDYCVAANGRKPCFLALPKQFDTHSNGFCTYLSEEHPSDLDTLCSRAMSQCVHDYEDEPFCTAILWGPRKKNER